MVEGKNNKQKNRTKYFLPGGKKQIQAVCAFLFLGVLILSCGVNLMHKDRQMSEKEMRMLAQKPESRHLRTVWRGGQKKVVFSKERIII